MNIVTKIMTGTALCIGFAQIVMPETVTIPMYKSDKTTHKDPWSYQLQIQKNPGVIGEDIKGPFINPESEEPLPPELKGTGTMEKVPGTKEKLERSGMKREQVKVKYTSVKKFNDRTTVSFDTNNYKTTLRVFSKPSAQTIYGVLDWVLKEGEGDARYQDKIIVLGFDKKSQKPIVEWADKSEEPNLLTSIKLPTRRVSVTKESNDKKKWTITATSNDGKLGYGSVVIQKDTIPFRGLPIPKTGDFAITVAGEGVSGSFKNVYQRIIDAAKIDSLLIKASGQVEVVEKK